jgi:KaiC/GvpD/RAD55 family RecA-like ATPase/quercetin dioxygenase-like cupin family protein
MPLKGKKETVTSGFSQLDELLGGVFIGDNIIWYDESGSLAQVFWRRFAKATLDLGKPLIYVCFDRSPKNLLERLGSMSESENLVVLDCFTNSKGKGLDTFLDFTRQMPPKVRERIISVENPADPEKFSEELYKVQGRFDDEVRLIFESLTGMQEVWGGEEQILHFYSHSCPRLYDLSTVAYWIMEKGAHSRKLRAQINQIAQVAIELSIRRGTSTLTVLKADGREPAGIYQPVRYATRGGEVVFAGEKHALEGENLGQRIRQIRLSRDMTQGENNMNFPSVPILVKMGEILGVDPGYFLSRAGASANKVVFSGKDAVPLRLSGLAPENGRAFLVTPMEFAGRAEVMFVEIKPGKSVDGHFLAHKGHEMGLVLEGQVIVEFAGSVEDAFEGDIIYLSDELPVRWRNPGESTARLVWAKLK